MYSTNVFFFIKHVENKMRPSEIRRAEEVLGRKLIRQRRDHNRLLGGDENKSDCDAIETIPYRGRFGHKDVQEYFREEYDKWSQRRTISPEEWDDYKTFYDRFVKISKRYEALKPCLSDVAKASPFCVALDSIPFGSKRFRERLKKHYDKWRRRDTIGPSEWKEYSKFYRRMEKLSEKHPALQACLEDVRKPPQLRLLDACTLPREELDHFMQANHYTFVDFSTLSR